MIADDPKRCKSNGKFPCPHDGCDGEFDTRNGQATHHKLVHGESIAGVKIICDWCGDTTRRERGEAENYDHHFCDLECRGKWHSEQTSGEGHYAWVEGAFEECANCGDEVRVRPYLRDAYDRHFCDTECHGEWAAENRVGENHHQWDRIEVPCAWCGDTLFRHPCRVERSDNHYCDLECLGEWRGENWVGESSPRWSGGALDYGPGWCEEKRESVREAQDRLCAGCGSPSQGPWRLPVHHIIPAREFDDPQKRNAADNLVALCRVCHKKWEGIPLKPQLDHS